MRIFAIDENWNIIKNFLDETDVVNWEKIDDWAAENDFFQILHQVKEGGPYYVAKEKERKPKPKDFYADMRSIGLTHDDCDDVLGYFANLSEIEFKQLQKEYNTNAK